MKLIFFLSYCGTKYNGWQKQKTEKNSPPKVETVQGIIEKTLKNFFDQAIHITASGRTDKGVHADEQVFSFTLTVVYQERINLYSLKKRFNNFLPEDIKIIKILKSNRNFNPRYHAKVRCYRYSLIKMNHYPKEAKYLGNCHALSFNINVEKLQGYFSLLEGEYDFSAFCSKKPNLKNKIRKIFKIDLISREPFIFIDLYGNAFLKSMVRSLVGNVLFAYQNKMPEATITEWLKKKDPNLTKKRVPPEGLSLRKVFYVPIFE